MNGMETSTSTEGQQFLSVVGGEDAFTNSSSDALPMPQSIEEARAQLMALFDNSNSNTSQEEDWPLNRRCNVQHVVSILQTFPLLAKETFSFSCPQMKRTLWERRARRDSRVRRSLAPGDVPIQLPPLCHVLKSPVVDLELVQAIVAVDPTVVKQWDSTGHGLLPLHVACFYKVAATPDIVGYLAVQYPNGITRAGKNVDVPLVVYMEKFILKRENQPASPVNTNTDHTDNDEEDAREQQQESQFYTQHKHICDILLQDDYFSQNGHLSKFKLTRAIQANCPPFIRYLLARAPEDLWTDEFIVTAKNLDLTVAKGMEVMVLEEDGPDRIRVSYDDNMTTEAFQHIFKTVGRMDQTARVESLTMLFPKVTPTTSNDNKQPIWQSLTNGLGRNRSLKYFRLKGKHFECGLLSDYLTLLQNAPPKLRLDDCWIGASPSLAFEVDDLLWQSSRLESLKLCSCQFDEESTFCAFLSNLCLLPQLKSLTLGIAGEPLSPDASREMMVLLVALLRQQSLQELFLDDIRLSNLPLFYMALKGNTSLKSLRVALTHWKDLDGMAKIMQDDNVTLQNLDYDVEEEEEEDEVGNPTNAGWGYGNITYHLMLNQYGRDKIRRDGTTVGTFVGLVTTVMDDEVKLREYPWGITSMLYGLLRERPSLWVDAAAGESTCMTGTISNNNQGAKRKAENKSLERDGKKPFLGV